MLSLEETVRGVYRNSLYYLAIFFSGNPKLFQNKKCILKTVFEEARTKRIECHKLRAREISGVWGVVFCFFIFYFGHTYGTWKFPGQGSNPCQILNLLSHQGTLKGDY